MIYDVIAIIAFLDVVELFPTNLRATGHAVCYSFARVGAFAAAYLIESNASIQTCAIGLGKCCILCFGADTWCMPLRF